MRTLICIATAIMAASTTLPAAAQSYFARERIAGLSAEGPQYVATYSSTFSTCTGSGTTGTQSAPITSCRLNGKDVALSSCPSQTKTQNCTPSPWRCNPMTANMSWNAGGQYTIIGQPGNVDSAQRMCDAYVGVMKQEGVCLYLPASGNAAYSTVVKTPVAINDPKSYAAACRMN